MAVAATVICGLLVSPTVGPFTTQARADDYQTRRYLERADLIFRRWEPVIRRNLVMNNLIGAAIACRKCAWEMGTMPFNGVDPDAVRRVRDRACLLDSTGLAILEDYDPWIPPPLIRYLELRDSCNRVLEDIRRSIEKETYLQQRSWW
jgi:hypothetical protein